MGVYDRWFPLAFFLIGVISYGIHLRTAPLPGYPRKYGNPTSDISHGGGTHAHTHTCIHTHIHTYTHTYIHTYIQTYDGVTHTAYVTPKVARWRYSMGSPLFIHHNTIEYNSTHTPHIWKHGMVIVECPTSKDSCRVDRSSNPKRR
jgi:hypothetical protein